MNVKPQRANNRGFTLLEVMIALVVFATLASAVLAASHYVVRQNARLLTQIQCAWVADNHLSELRLQPPRPGRQRVLRRLDGREWLLEQIITPANDPRLLRVDVRVSPADSAQIFYSTYAWVPAGHE